MNGANHNQRCTLHILVFFTFFTLKYQAWRTAKTSWNGWSVRGLNNSRYEARSSLCCRQKTSYAFFCVHLSDHLLSGSALNDSRKALVSFGSLCTWHRVLQNHGSRWFCLFGRDRRAYRRRLRRLLTRHVPCKSSIPAACHFEGTWLVLTRLYNLLLRILCQQFIWCWCSCSMQSVLLLGCCCLAD